ncbi:MAG: ATP-binding cassette domain-containing protein [Planctomycetota bacterium]
MIEIKGFTKRYDRFLAVDALSLQIQKGEIFGFIGPNGAGKTTTIRLLATLLKPTTGSAFVNGFSVTQEVDDVKRSIGYMPDTFGTYDGMKCWEFLDFFAMAYGIEAAKRKTIIGDVLELLDLTGKRDTLVNGLSRGMQQRLALAKTLLHDPPVLILDEPASGLDPRARVEMKELLKELKMMGKTILISSHILSELADFCTTIGIIERGRLLASGEVREVIANIRQHRVIVVKVLGQETETEVVLRRHEEVRDLAAADKEFRFSFTGNDEELVRLHAELIQSNLPVIWFREEETTLEEVFMTVTKGGGAVA